MGRADRAKPSTKLSEMAGGNCLSLDYGLFGAFDQVEAIVGVGRFATNQNVYRGHSAQP